MAEPDPVVLPGPYGGHPGSVFAVTYSPDGALLASGGWDGTVRLWDTRAGAEAGVLSGHVGPVRTVAFSPDGTQLASAGRDQTIRLWDLVTRDPAGMLPGPRGAVLSIAFAPGGELLASAGEDGTVRLWDVRDGGSQVEEFPDDARAVAFSPDGRLLAAAGRDKGIVLRELADRTVSALGGPVGAIRSVAFAPGGGLLASAGEDGTVRLWDLHDSTQVQEHPDDARTVAFSPDGRLLATAGRDQGIWMRDLTGGGPAARRGQDRRFHGVAFTPDGTRLAGAGDGGDIVVYDLVGGAAPAVLVGHTCEILSAAYSPDGTLLATGDVDGSIRVWSTARGTLARCLGGDGEWVRSLAFSQAGGLLAAAIGGRIRVWDVAAGFEPGTVADRGRDAVTAVTFGPDSPGVSLLVSADEGGELTAWNARDGSQIATAATSGRVASVAIDRAGTLIASADGDGFVRRWDLGAATRQAFAPAIGQARCVALHPDGHVLAGAGADGVIQLWNVAHPAAPAAVLAGHEGTVRALAFAPDGTLLASGGDDATVRLWDARTGASARELVGHPGVIRSLAFAPDSLTLVSVGDDGRISRWSTRTGALARGGGPLARPARPLPGIRSDDPSRVDLLGMADDVEMLATLIAAAGTEPPLAVALLGEWGAGKSSLMLQVHDAVEQLAARTRRDPGHSSFAGNVRQVRFNAWHYSDDQVWTGLIGHLFATLAAAPGDSRPPPGPGEVSAERDRLRQELRAQQARCAELDGGRAARRAALRSAAWRDRGPFLLRALLAALALAVLTAGQWLSGGLAALLGPAWRLGSAGQRRVTDWSAAVLAAEAAQAHDLLAALEDQLAQVDAAVRLARLLKRDGDLDPYGGGRGLLGQVHHDLEQLSEDLDRLRRERLLAGQVVPPPLERIVLYIDDLDRCAPARVVEVLAAVHLMLALPLFVVIVAVDPRWLLGALRHHYRDLFAGSGPPEAGELGPGDGPAATPLDYLDKIFQIPFAVRPPAAPDTAGFLTALLGHDPAGGTGDSPGPALQGPGAPGGVPGSELLPSSGSPAPPPPPRPLSPAMPAAASRARDPGRSPSPGRVGDRRRPPGTGQPAGTGQPTAADRPSPALPPRDAGPDLRPGGLVLRPLEAEFMVRLGPLLPTPRAAKKLVNLYRLVRIGIPEDELQAFIRPDGYQAVQLLLAVLVGTPAAAPAIFTAIRAAAGDADIVSVIRAAGPVAGGRTAEFLDAIRRATPEALADITAYQRWCPTLARYSFHTRSLAGW